MWPLEALCLRVRHGQRGAVAVGFLDARESTVERTGHGIQS